MREHPAFAFAQGDICESEPVGTHTPIDAHHAGIKTFVHISTDEGSWPEAHPLRPNSPYSSAKACGPDWETSVDTKATQQSGHHVSARFPLHPGGYVMVKNRTRMLVGHHKDA